MPLDGKLAATWQQLGGKHVGNSGNFARNSLAKAARLEIKGVTPVISRKITLMRRIRENNGNFYLYFEQYGEQTGNRGDFYSYFIIIGTARGSSLLSYLPAGRPFGQAPDLRFAGGLFATECPSSLIELEALHYET